MEVDRKDFFLALQMVKGGLAKKEIVEQTKSYLFVEGGIVTYNDEIYAYTPFDLGEVRAAVPSDELAKILGRMPDDRVDVSFADKQLTIRGKGKKTTINGSDEILLPIDAFREVAQEKKWLKLEEHFSDHLRIASFVASRDVSEGVLCYVHVAPDRIEATDRQKACRTMLVTGIKKSILIDYEAAALLNDIAPVEVRITEEWAYFRNEQGTIIGTRHRLETFPDLSSLFGKASGKPFALPSAMEEIIERAEVFAKDDSGLENAIKIALKDGKIIISSQAARGSYQEVRKVKYAGDAVSFNVNPALLCELLQHGKDVLVGGGKLTVTINDFHFVICLQDSE